MTNFSRNFIAGRMNKVVDERLVPNGEYIDALNIRMGSTENSEVGVIENSKGNLPLTSIAYIDGTPLSADALCIGAFARSSQETIYWFVHDPSFPVGATGKLDLIVSMNVVTGILTYNVISINDGGGFNTTLNFDPKYVIPSVNIIGNLLFFTDGFNPPRFINTTRNYPNPVSNIDDFSYNSILVIKQPPVAAPLVQPVKTSDQSNYMDTRFISFAYRYRYVDNEYSATSQWSDIAFVPNNFAFVDDSVLNAGMTNSCNAANVTYNSGGELVVGIDLLFKQADGNIIKVIEKINKKDAGLSDDTTYTFTFSNSKIFTILPESELLRLYDNVPLTAFAQTIMGNRLMYGNYTDGYELLDADGFPIMLEYTTDMITAPVGQYDISPGFQSNTYTIDTPHFVDLCKLQFYLGGLDLIAGSSISFRLVFTHDSFTGTVPPPYSTSENISVNFTVILNGDYASVYEFATSAEFQNAIGTLSNIQPVSTACNGYTLTDVFNCQVPGTLNTYTKYASGITGVGQPVLIGATLGSGFVTLLFPAMRFVNNTGAPTASFYEYYGISYAGITYKKIASPRSLHSNRGYEIGIVYMDEFNRATTALVSPNNTEHIPCSYSANQNSIQVTIPPTQKPPAFAKRYKFVCKPDASGFETIFSNIYFLDPNSNNCYILLEGENARKVEVGDRLIIKADSDGPTKQCSYITVLEKESKSSGFITPVSGAAVPAGVYMKVSLTSISIVELPNGYINPGKEYDVSLAGACPEVNYPMNIESSPGVWTDYTVPLGSKIRLLFGFQSIYGERTYFFDKTFTSSSQYANMEDWWLGDNIASYLNDGTAVVQPGSTCPIQNIFLSGHGVISNCDYCNNYYRFDVLGGGELILRVKGSASGYGFADTSTVTVQIQVYRSAGSLIFETQPTDALPDVFFENNMSFDIIDGNHMGNVQNQDIATSTPAIINTEFFNCFAFGNGTESYKILDSIIGHSFDLGNRVTTTAAEDYGKSDNFADITYSGVYNAETNVNKLNEFNIGLVNLKELEVSFGSIRILDGRETDVLVLQEDKVSYVLAGKNLLSDSAAGGAVTSVPEVLGTQIARTEKYGISFNPESYVHWGYDRYFTDVKRGAVIQLKGTSYNDEQLFVVSEANMRTWFRDQFINSFSTQKIGGYDPYMNEYVLSINDREIPSNPSCLACGVTQNFTINGPIDAETRTRYCVDLGATVGTAQVQYSVTSLQPLGEVQISANYNGTTTLSPLIIAVGAGHFDINKNLSYKDLANLTITSLGAVEITITVTCPDASYLNVVQVVITNDSQSSETIHAEYRYFSGPYVSPLQSTGVTFASGTSNPLVSLYSSSHGLVGSGGFPVNGSTVRIQSNKILPDTFDFSPYNNSFRYLKSNTSYANNPTDIAALVAASSLATPILNPSKGIYYAQFTQPSTPGSFLYLIWDLRTSNSVLLCHSTILSDVCCGCVPCNSCQLIHISAGGSACEVFLPDGFCGDSPGDYVTISLDPSEEYEQCFNPNQNYIILSGTPTVSVLSCGCQYCAYDCSKWIITSDGLGSAIFKVNYIDCAGVLQQVSVTAPNTQLICAKRGTTPTPFSGVGTIDLFQYCTNPADC